MNRPLLTAAVLLAVACGAEARAQQAPTRDEASAAMKRAARFFHEQVSSQGGYVWKYSSDLALRQGEAVTDTTRVWVQPPGTPAVGAAMLDAYQATGDRYYLDAARATADVLIRGQQQSGGWDYSIELDPEKRQAFNYRGQKRRKKARDYTTLDDNVTQSATRFLVQLDGVLQQRDEAVHEAAEFALRSILAAQYPNGGWYVWWKEYPQAKSAEEFPVTRGAFPAEWNRTWQAKYPGIYVTNDNLMSDMIDLLLMAHETYGGERYLEAARRGGDFLILAQMPEPQPAWAQQYDAQMHPVWARKFEPPAVSGSETQTIIRGLMQLYRATGQEKYLEPIPAAIAWLRRSQVEPGKVARFYELQTNRPLYFERRGDVYTLIYEIGPRLPDHYGFVVGVDPDRLERDYRRCREEGPGPAKRTSGGGVSSGLARQVSGLIASLDERGAWTEPGWVRDAQAKKVEPPGGIVDSATFIKNLRTLADYVRRLE